MNPSAQRPTRSNAFGPYPAIQIGSSGTPGAIHGIWTDVPPRSTDRPAARSRITPMAASRRASVVGGRPCTRIAESPRPIPQIVRCPNCSSSVACRDAMTVQSRVPGLVTIGPTIILDVRSRIRG